MLCFHEDEFRFETEHPGSQCLLVVGQRAALTPFSIQFMLQSPTTLHEFPFVEALQRVV